MILINHFIFHRFLFFKHKLVQSQINIIFFARIVLQFKHKPVIALFQTDRADAYFFNDPAIRIVQVNRAGQGVIDEYLERAAGRISGKQVGIRFTGRCPLLYA
jgi:hypothetical protein